jgi:hypothetical protein
MTSRNTTSLIISYLYFAFIMRQGRNSVFLSLWQKKRMLSGGGGLATNQKPNQTEAHLIIQ